VSGRAEDSVPVSVVAASPEGTPSPSLVNDGADVVALVREFFGMGVDVDLTGAGVDRLPGWDSLRHIELMLFVEERLAMKFDASEIERTSDLERLSALVTEKRGARHAASG